MLTKMLTMPKPQSGGKRADLVRTPLALSERIAALAPETPHCGHCPAQTRFQKLESALDRCASGQDTCPQAVAFPIRLDGAERPCVSPNWRACVQSVGQGLRQNHGDAIGLRLREFHVGVAIRSHTHCGRVSE